MAIHPTSPAPEEQGRRDTQPEATASPPPQPQFLPFHVTIDETTSTFVSSTTAQNNNNSNNATTLTIPLDIPHSDDIRKQRPSGLTLPQSAEKERPPCPAKAPVRRDSLRHRDELLRGNPGTRRRQRWENDRLLSNPYLTPPTPADFLPVPTHPRKIVHYDLACLWDSQYRKQHQQKLDLEATERAERHADEPCIPRELRAGLKKARGAAGIVRMLEERVREFIEKAAAAAASAALEAGSGSGVHEEGWEVVDHSHGTPSEDEHELDEEDKEVIIFKPKKKSQKQHTATPSSTSTTVSIYQSGTLPPALPVYHSPPTDPSAPFIRWLVHSIAEYYGLHSWSVTEKNPPVESESAGLSSRGQAPKEGEVRVAYVGLHTHQEKSRSVQKQKQQRGKTKAKGKNKKDKRKKVVEEEQKLEKKQEENQKYKKPVEVKLPVKLPRPLWLML